VEVPKLGYRWTWSKTFYNDEMDSYYLGPGYTAPVRCPDHIDPATGRGWCFKCCDDINLPEGAGDWKPKVPIDIPTAMPGYNQRLLLLTTMGMHAGSFGIGGWGYCNVRLFGDGAEIFRTDSLDFPEKKWAQSWYELNLPVDIYTKLELWLHQHAVVRLPSTWVCIHISQVKLDAEYYSDIPPETADVRIDVYNRETGAIISGAYVALMSGTIVVARGYTDGGTVTFTGIEEGSYTLRVRANGFEPYEATIEVAPPEVWVEVPLSEIPAPPWPWWWWIPVAGVGGIAGVWLIRQIFAPPPAPPVYVVR